MIRQGVILAGGNAERMRPVSDHYTKALLPAGSQSILSFQIAEMLKLGVSELFIVHQGGANGLRSAIPAEFSQQLNFRFVEQWAARGIGHALLAVENLVTDVFVVYLGDIYYETGDITLIEKYLESGDCILTVKDSAQAADIHKNFSVEINHGYAVRVVEKPAMLKPEMRQGCGIYIFRPEIFQALRNTTISSVRGEYELTDGIQKLIDAGQRVMVADVFSFEINVNSPRDLYDLNQHILRNTEAENIISKRAKIHPSARVSKSVICNNVIVGENCLIENSIVLDSTNLPANTSVRRSIVGLGFHYPINER